MRLFIDECLSPEIARRLNSTGEHVAEHPLDFGGRGDPDYRVLQRCIARGLVIVTENALDFRALVGAEEIHPGLIVLPCVGREKSFALLNAAINFLQGMDDEAMDIMIIFVGILPQDHHVFHAFDVLRHVPADRILDTRDQARQLAARILN